MLSSQEGPSCHPCHLHSLPLTGSSWGGGSSAGWAAAFVLFSVSVSSAAGSRAGHAGPPRPFLVLLLYSATCLLSASWSIPHRLAGTAEPKASLGDGVPGASGSLAARSTNEAPERPRGDPRLAPTPPPVRPPHVYLTGRGGQGRAAAWVLAFSSPEAPRPHSWCLSGTGQPPCRSPAHGQRTRSASPLEGRGPPGRFHAAVGGAFQAPPTPVTGYRESPIESARRAKPAPLQPDLASPHLQPPIWAQTVPRPQFASPRWLPMGGDTWLRAAWGLCLRSAVPEGSAHRPPPGRLVSAAPRSCQCPREADAPGLGAPAPAHAPQVLVAFSRPPWLSTEAAMLPRPPLSVPS